MGDAGGGGREKAVRWSIECPGSLSPLGGLLPVTPAQLMPATPLITVMYHGGPGSRGKQHNWITCWHKSVITTGRRLQDRRWIKREYVCKKIRSLETI